MEKENTKEEIKQMEIGDVISYPIERLAVIRTYAWEIGLVMNRNYKTYTHKDERMVTVKRLA